jgi:phosphohistidine phosphatase
VLIGRCSTSICQKVKKLYLIRHAKSSWKDPEMDDFYRPLNERGERDAPRMSKRLKEKKVTPDWMIASPAIRTSETCKVFAKTLGYPLEKINLDERLYHATEDQLLEVIYGLKDRPRDDQEIVLLFGHNPGLTDFANRLTGNNIPNIPTCGIVVAQFKVATWKEVAFGSGQMVSFDFPKSENLMS